jgi:hypothetical protein
MLPLRRKVPGASRRSVASPGGARIALRGKKVKGSIFNLRLCAQPRRLHLALGACKVARPGTLPARG